MVQKYKILWYRNIENLCLPEVAWAAGPLNVQLGVRVGVLGLRAAPVLPVLSVATAVTLVPENDNVEMYVLAIIQISKLLIPKGLAEFTESVVLVAESVISAIGETPLLAMSVTFS